MTAHERLAEFDREWDSFARQLREGSLHVLAVTSSGGSEYKWPLPREAVKILQPGIKSYAIGARAMLLEEARKEARRTLGIPDDQVLTYAGTSDAVPGDG